jgi:hypothetical protein
MGGMVVSSQHIEKLISQCYNRDKQALHLYKLKTSGVEIVRRRDWSMIRSLNLGNSFLTKVNLLYVMKALPRLLGRNGPICRNLNSIKIASLRRGSNKC